MGSTTTVLTANGLALHENCRWLVEQWLQRDLRRLMQISLDDHEYEQVSEIKIAPSSESSGEKRFI